MDRLVVIGEIVRPHGLRGELRVIPRTDDVGRFARVTECVLWDAVRDAREPRRITAVRRHGSGVLVSLSGCETPVAAAALVGCLLAIPDEAALPLGPGQFYPWQLQGCRVVDDAGAEIGSVAGIERSAAHDLWVVRGPSREHLIPAVPDIVLEVDLAARRVVIRPPPGLLDL
jgi:16S rRNA processing protein RimM